MRFPDDGPVFYVGLAVGDSELGLSSDASVVAGGGRPDAAQHRGARRRRRLPKVAALGGTATSGANDMPWGQRVAHIKDPTERRQPDQQL